MPLIEFYSLISNLGKKYNLHKVDSDLIIGNISINKNNIEINLENNDINGQINGFIPSFENIIIKNNYKMIINSLSNNLHNYNIHIIIDTHTTNILKTFIYFDLKEQLIPTNIISEPEPWLYFSDGDQDDLYTLNVLIAQHYLKKINLIGIVCDIGFFPDINQCLSITKFWVNDILHSNIPIYIGEKRPKYLENNVFPSYIIDGFIEKMIKDFGYNPNKSYLNNGLLDSLILSLYNYNDYSLKILTTGPATSIQSAIIKYPWFINKIKKCTSMIGNYSVPGNLIDSNINAEYNAYLNPASLNIIINILKNNLCIVPLDCTNYIPLNKRMINELEDYGKSLSLIEKDEYIIYIFQKFIELLNTVVVTEEEGILYMWDLCTLAIALDLDCEQKYIIENFDIKPSGKIVTSTTTNSSSVLYNFISYYKFKTKIIDAIFANL